MRTFKVEIVKRGKEALWRGRGTPHRVREALASYVCFRPIAALAIFSARGGGVMGLRSWWQAEKQRAARSRRQESSLAPEIIASQVPELAGMSQVEGMAFTLQEIEKWKPTATPEQWAEIQRRQTASISTFEVEGLIMPYWGNLWLLRTYQRELGLDVPWIAPSSGPGDV